MMNSLTGSTIKFTNASGYYIKDNPLSGSLMKGFLVMLKSVLELSTSTKFLSPEYIFIYTKNEFDQAPHIDLDESLYHPLRPLGWIMHLPLYKEGMWIRVWPQDGVQRIQCGPEFVHIPFGTVLFLRADVSHSGIYGSTGNIRLHCPFIPVDSPSETRILMYTDDYRHDNTEVIYHLCPDEQEHSIQMHTVQIRAKM